jgi:hypothetical protein
MDQRIRVIELHLPAVFGAVDWITSSKAGVAGLVVALALVAAGTRSACAQDTTLPGGVQILFTPYLWLAGVHSTILTPLERAPEIMSVPFNCWAHLSAVPFLGSVEIRDRPFGLLGGAIHLPVGTDITTRNVFFNGGNAGLAATRIVGFFVSAMGMG